MSIKIPHSKYNHDGNYGQVIFQEWRLLFTAPFTEKQRSTEETGGTYNQNTFGESESFHTLSIILANTVSVTENTDLKLGEMCVYRLTAMSDVNSTKMCARYYILLILSLR